MAISWEAQAAHDEAVARGDEGYMDPDTGLFVMTAQYLTDRGYCCDNGCRHCPYDTPEPEAHDETKARGESGA